MKVYVVVGKSYQDEFVDSYGDTASPYMFIKDVYENIIDANAAADQLNEEQNKTAAELDTDITVYGVLAYDIK